MIFSEKNALKPVRWISSKCFEKKKSPFGRIILPFFFESSESDRVFNYLQDSNSIFRAAGIDSERCFGRTVHDDLDDGIGTGDQWWKEMEGNPFCGRNGERITDSQLRPKSLTRKLPGAHSSKGLVWRSLLTTNRRKWEKTTRHWSVPRKHWRRRIRGEPVPFWTNVSMYDREISFHQLPEGDVPGRGGRQDSSASSWRERDVCTQDLPIEIKMLVCWILLVAKAKARFFTLGEHCRVNAQGWWELMLRECTGQQSVYSFNLFHRWDGVGVSGVWMFSVPFWEENLENFKTRLFSEPLSRGLRGIGKGALIEIVKGVFGLPDSPRGWCSWEWSSCTLKTWF